MPGSRADHNVSPPGVSYTGFVPKGLPGKSGVDPLPPRPDNLVGYVSDAPRFGPSPFNTTARGIGFHPKPEYIAIQEEDGFVVYGIAPTRFEVRTPGFLEQVTEASAQSIQDTTTEARQPISSLNDLTSYQIFESVMIGAMVGLSLAAVVTLIVFARETIQLTKLARQAKGL